MRSIALLGRDWTELGPLAVAELPDGGAIALSRGLYPKAYAHTDPNEDAALLVRAANGTVLAVADGFNGTKASELAVERVRARAEELLAASGPGFRAEVARVAAEVRAALPARSRSRSCLVLAALSGERCELASLGDSNAFVAGDPHPLARQNSLLLGNSDPLPQGRAELFHWPVARADGARIALVSDGVTNFVDDLSRIPRLLAESASDADAARAIAELAFAGGAGDNVGVAVFEGRAGPGELR
ncbi:MAG TPA: protein phosphatase 2C domain-containing protein [Myxococcota bacterium]|nr:protein phosphatase 2C domain-containing protein [Myxococcota bacterium]